VAEINRQVETEMKITQRVMRVQWGECDPAGIVFFPRYFEYFNISTEAHLEICFGRKKPRWVSDYGIIGIPSVGAQAKFISPSRYGDDIVVETAFTEIKRTSFSLQHRIFNDGKLAVEGAETRVWTGRDPTDPSRLKGLPLPPEIMRFA
jgi:4-hydroxybenzoyl-CoA thioesterase